MAFGEIKQFYITYQQFELMNYLSRKGIDSYELANLTWEELRVKSRKLVKDGELRNKVFRMLIKLRTATIPVPYVFYREVPSGKNPKGVTFTEDEVWRLCGRPKRRIVKPRMTYKNAEKRLTLAGTWLTIEVGKKQHI